MFKYIENSNTLIIMMDTTIYSDEDDFYCYDDNLVREITEGESKKDKLCILQDRIVSEKIGDQKFKNIIICGHHPLAGLKTQILNEEGKLKGGEEILGPDIFRLIEKISKNSEKFYYLCADTHNYQKGVITLTFNNGSRVTIEQHIVGIGGTGLDDDYNEKFVRMSDAQKKSIKKGEKLLSDFLPEIPVNSFDIPPEELGSGFGLNYTILEHFSDYGYLVVEIDDASLIHFEIVNLGIMAGKHRNQSLTSSMLGGKRRNKRTNRRRNKSTIRRRNKRTNRRRNKRT
jgi:hypothetical protein